MKKKGQVAMESLMIYGIALLIVAMAIAALVYFGVLDLGGLLPEKCDVKGGIFTCKEYAVFSEGKIQLEIQNNYGKNLQGVSVTINSEDDSFGIIKDDCLLKFDTSDSTTLVNGETKLFEGNCGESTSSLESLIGKKVKANIAIEWQSAGSDITKTSYGTILATVSE